MPTDPEQMKRERDYLAAQIQRDEQARRAVLWDAYREGFRRRRQIKPRNVREDYGRGWDACLAFLLEPLTGETDPEELR